MTDTLISYQYSYGGDPSHLYADLISLDLGPMFVRRSSDYQTEGRSDGSTAPQRVTTILRVGLEFKPTAS